MSEVFEEGSLEAAAASLVRRLGGTWRPQGAMCRCPAHDDRTPSLSVRVGDRSLLFKCFAGCSTGEILRTVSQLGQVVPVNRSTSVRVSRSAINEMDRAVRDLWQSAAPLSGSPGEIYFHARSLPAPSSEVRYHPRAPLGRGRLVRFRPAILAAVREGPSLVAVQRLFLAACATTLAEDLMGPRRTLGRLGAGTVRLRPAGRVLGLAEGVETAASASLLLNLPVWATLGNERLARVAVPECVEHLVLLADNDRAGRLAADAARERYAGSIATIETIWPWYGLNDWNDVIRKGAKRVSADCGLWPGEQAAPHTERLT